MFKEKYILDNEIIKPDEKLLASLKIQMKAYAKTREFTNDIPGEDLHSHHSFANFKSFLKYSSLAACFLILIIFFSYNGLLSGSKGNTKAPQDTAKTESTAAEAENDTLESYSFGIMEDSKADLDSGDEKADAGTKAAKKEIKSSAAGSFIDGKITISKENVNSILIEKNEGGTSSHYAFTDASAITSIIDCLNTLALTPALDIPSGDDNETVLTIEYNNGENQETIHLKKSYLKMNGNGWYQLEETALETLYSLLNQ